MQEWIFRVASRPSDGGGHVSRCLPLAREMARVGNVEFRLDPGGSQWVSFLAVEGFSASVDDPADCALVAGCVLDGHDFNQKEIARWRARSKLLAIVDDYGLPPPIADIAVCQWISDFPSESAPQVLCGLRHVLIDPAYASLPSRPNKPVAERVLVSFGRVDSPNVAGMVMESLFRLGERGWTPDVTVVVGTHAPHRIAVTTAAERLGARCNLLVGPRTLVDVMGRCDIAIGAGGVSAAERAAAGRPSIVISQVENQPPVARTLAAAGATIDLGPVRQVSVEILDETLLALARDPGKREALGAAGRLAVDGRGPERIAAALLERSGA